MEDILMIRVIDVPVLVPVHIAHNARSEPAEPTLTTPGRWGFADKSVRFRVRRPPYATRILSTAPNHVPSSPRACTSRVDDIRWVSGDIEFTPRPPPPTALPPLTPIWRPDFRFSTNRRRRSMTRAVSA
jgi:hypothetical protein